MYAQERPGASMCTCAAKTLPLHGSTFRTADVGAHDWGRGGIIHNLRCDSELNGKWFGGIPAKIIYGTGNFCLVGARCTQPDCPTSSWLSTEPLPPEKLVV